MDSKKHFSLPTVHSSLLFIDPPADGVWNMAVDEVLLDWAAQSGECALRFYQWSEPTLSLGYFQTYADRREHCASQSCQAVRRLTGGGAIIHDHELTYSLVIPSDHPLARMRQDLYRLVHATLIGALTINWSIVPSICSTQESEEPFLCFQRRAPGDVLAGQTKIAGSAQRRRRGAVLQHGSVLLRRSTAAPELDSLEDVSGQLITPDQLIAAWLPLWAYAPLNLNFVQAELPDSQQQAVRELADSKYGTEKWTENRGR